MGDSAEMFRIDDLARGTPAKSSAADGTETPAEPPDWRKLRKECELFLSKSKHLKVAVILTTCLLKQKGLEGFRDGLQVILGYVREYWDAFHPLLDPSDGNDPTQRLNLLGTLKRPRWPAEWLLPMNHLYEVPLAGSEGRFVTLAMVDLSRGRPNAGDGFSSAMDAATLTTLLRDTPQEQLAGTVALLQEILKLVDELEALLTAKVGSAKAESFDDLRDAVGRMEGVISPYLQSSSEESPADDGDVQAAGIASVSSRSESPGESGLRAEGGTGNLRSREDVVRQLGIICDFLTRTEPSSPIIFILRRAQRMVGMDFLQVVAELSLGGADVRETLKPVMGIGLPEKPAEPAAQSTAGT